MAYVNSGASELVALILYTDFKPLGQSLDGPIWWLWRGLTGFLLSAAGLGVYAHRHHIW